jgi:hypothetical protein
VDVEMEEEGAMRAACSLEDSVMFLLRVSGLGYTASLGGALSLLLPLPALKLAR